MSDKVYSRCSTARLSFVTADGKTISDKDVRVTLKNHEFLFGCGGFDGLNAANPIPPFVVEMFKKNGIDDPKAFFTSKMDKWFKVFNYTTLPFYWGGYEPKEGDVQFENRMNGVNLFLEHGVEVKGHPLCWHTVCADWLMQYDNKTIMEKQLARINRDVTAFKGKIDKWDVINETVIMPVFDKYDNAVTRICNEYGRMPLIKEVFDAAHSANPDALLLINDFNLSDDYRRVISDALDMGVPIGAIGIQTHQHQGYKGLKWLEDILKRFSVFGLPLHFTENTLVSGQIMPAHIVDLNDYVVDEWPSTPEGEARQCAEWEEMLKRLFEEPLVEAVTGWDFTDGAWLKAPSGFLRLDNTEKPSYFKLKELIHEKWITDENIRTDKSGSCDFFGYRGEYEASVDGRTATFKLDKSSKDIKIIL